MTDHLAKAKDYIAKGDDYYFKAAAEILAAKEERPELTWVEIGRQLGRSEAWVRRLVVARNDFLKTGEFEVAQHSGSNKRDEVVHRALTDPDRRRDAVAGLKPEEREALAVEVTRDLSSVVDDSLDVQVARFLTQASRVEVLLGEGRTFANVKAQDADRLLADLAHVESVVERLRESVNAHRTVRRVA